MLLVHGFPLDHSMWEGQWEFLAKDHDVIVPDLRGFGQSAPTDDPVSMERYADELAGLLDALDLGQPVIFAGLSMGGYVAWQFFRRHRSRLRALILCDTRAVADSEEGAKGRLEQAERVLREGMDPVVRSMLPRLVGPNVSSSIKDKLERMMRGTSPRGAAAALRAMAVRPDVRPMLSAIDVPTLVLVGEHDAISTPDEMREIADAIPGSRFVVVPDAGHMAPMESQGPTTSAIAFFLASLTNADISLP